MNPTTTRQLPPFRAAVLASVLAAAGACFPLASCAMARPATTHQLMTTTNDKGDKVQFDRTDDQYTITLNGKEVKKGKVGDADWDSWSVKNDKGEVIATITHDGDDFGISSGDTDNAAASAMARSRAEREIARVQRYRMAPRAYGGVTGPMGQNLGNFIAVANPPKVMMGVTLGTPDESLAEQVGVKPEEATLVETITKGLPADQAGLKRHDVIVKADGKSPCGESDLRSLLREKNPGDELQLDIVRRGEKQSVTIKLAAYDNSKLASATWSGTFGSNLEREEQAKELANLADQLRKSAGEASRGSGAAAAEANKQLEEVSKRMAELAQRLAEVDASGFFKQTFPGTVQLDPSGTGTIVIQPGQAPVAVPAVPGVPAQPNAFGMSPRHDRELSERIDKLEQQIDKLQRMLEKVIEEKSPSAPASTPNNH